jgi:hypothetical protein
MNKVINIFNGTVLFTGTVDECEDYIKQKNVPDLYKTVKVEETNII